MALKFITICKYLLVAIWLAQVAVSRSPPEIDRREAGLFLLRNPYLPYYAGVPEVANSYLSSAPIISPTGRTAAGARQSNSNVSNNLGPFFGYFPNMLGSKPCVCPALPAECPATTKPATIAITVPTSTACTSPSTMENCARSTAAPSGTFTVTFSVVGSVAAMGVAPSMVSLGIVPTCPNTQVVVTCPTISPNVMVHTQLGAVAAMAPVTVKSGDVHLLVANSPGAVAGATATCTWMAS